MIRAAILCAALLFSLPALASDPTGGPCTRVKLASPISDNAGNCSYTDVTGLSFAADSGKTYQVSATIFWTTAAATTSAGFSFNGPANSYLSIRLFGAAGAGTTSLQNMVAYDTASCPAAALTAGNITTLMMRVTTTAAGTIIVRVASEIDTSAVTVLAGSYLDYCEE